MTIRVGRLTTSDRAAAGIYPDLGGPEIELHISSLLAAHTIEWHRRLIPDDQPTITANLRELCDTIGCHLVVTTGGTGPTRRDVTPEATREVLEKELPGFGEIMRTRTFDLAPTSILSRATAGIRGATLIINLPGKPSAVGECLSVVGPAIEKALALLQG